MSTSNEHLVGFGITPIRVHRYFQTFLNPILPHNCGDSLAGHFRALPFSGGLPEITPIHGIVAFFHLGWRFYSLYGQISGYKE